MYQALFYPSLTDVYGNNILWSGQVYSLFVDHYGNFREDTNDNAVLDMRDDRITVLFFDQSQSQTMVRFYDDADGDGLADDSGTIGDLADLNPIWDGSKWLARANPNGNRGYNLTTMDRFVWTWIDQNDDGVVSDDGMVEGTETATSETILFDPSQTINRQAIAPYLRARAIMSTDFSGDHNDLEFTAVDPGVGGNDIIISYVNTGANADLAIDVTGATITVTLATDVDGNIVTDASQVASLINGTAASMALVTARLPEGDQGENKVEAMAPTSLSLEDGTQKLMEYLLGEDKDYWRKRQIDVPGEGVLTWKLGDVVYSTPTVVGAPSEDYDLIYGDSSYYNYRLAYNDRRRWCTSEPTTACSTPLTAGSGTGSTGRSRPPSITPR